MTNTEIQTLIDKKRATRAQLDGGLQALFLRPADYPNKEEARTALANALKTEVLATEVEGDFNLPDLVKVMAFSDALLAVVVAATRDGKSLLEVRHLAKAAGLPVAGRSKLGLLSAAQRTLNALAGDLKHDVLAELAACAASYVEAPAAEVPEAPVGWHFKPYKMDVPEWEANVLERATALLDGVFNDVFRAVRKEPVSVMVSPTGEQWRLGRCWADARQVARDIMSDPNSRPMARAILAQQPSCATVVRENIAAAALAAAIEAHPHNLHEVGVAAKEMEANLSGAVAEALEAILG